MARAGSKIKSFFIRKGAVRQYGRAFPTAFFEDICSPHELRTIEQRFQLLFLLTSGRSYSEIGEITGASSATISRASRQIANSHCGIAEIILRHTKAEE